MKAVLYCRISRDPHGTELGVKRQEQDCRALAEREGYELVGVFVDDDLSAFSGKKRPQFEAMRQLLAGGGVDVVVAWHPDRLTRMPRELEDLIDLLKATNTTVRTVQTGEYDLTTPGGRMSARLIGTVARHESEHKSERLKRKHLELAQNGENAGGGLRPFGFHSDRITLASPDTFPCDHVRADRCTARPDEAQMIRDAASWVLAGAALRDVCRRLNAAGVASAGGGEWRAGAMRTMLLSARIAGLREHERAGVTDAVWPAIITADDRLRLQAILSDPKRRTGTGGREMKLLTGLLVCGLCGEHLRSRPRRDQRPTYRCISDPGFKGCGSILITGEPLDEYVVDAALHYVDSPAVHDALAPPEDDEQTLAELRALETHGKMLAEMLGTGELKREQWATASLALETRKRELEGDLVTDIRARSLGEVPSLLAQWEHLTHEQRRQVLAAVIERIVILPAVPGANQFDDARVEIMWRS